MTLMSITNLENPPAVDKMDFDDWTVAEMNLAQPGTVLGSADSLG